jgi:hypothetical protein
MSEVARFLNETFKISLDIQKQKGKKLADFKVGLAESAELKQIGEEVHKFSVQFDIPGFDATKIDCK